MAATTKNELALDAGGMDLDATLDCGQTFSWWRQGTWRCGVAGRRAVLARQAGNTLLLRRPDGTPLGGEEAAFWRGYFALNDDYAGLHRRLCQNDALAACVAAAPGIRVLRQPFYDTLLAFILSQNSNIPRITRNADGLRRLFGEALYPGVHAFPAPKRLAALDEEALAPLRLGYRARYLVAAGRAVAEGMLDEAALRGMRDADARGVLLGVPGVGPKVADCVLLFGLSRHGVAPVDTWIRKALPILFPGGGWPACAAGCEGIAQQYVFAWARQNL